MNQILTQIGIWETVRSTSSSAYLRDITNRDFLRSLGATLTIVLGACHAAP